MAGIDRERCIQTLKEISAFPTAPYHESRIAAYILSELDDMGIPWRQDSYGNIIASWEDPCAPLEGGIALAAHMDHPGLDIVDPDGRKARLLGGVKQDCFKNPVPVLLFPSLSPEPGTPEDGVKGVISNCLVNDEGQAHFDLDCESEPPALPAFGVWDLPPFEMRDDLIYMRAADDIVGCAIILLTLRMLSVRKMPCRCHGIFTRAEENGFIGITALVKEQILPPDTVVVSLETSKELPGAVVGSGPVIRVGDTIMTFNGHAETLLDAAYRGMSAENPSVQVQRQLMSGGGCEGTVYMLAGYLATGMALPLGNYHNMGSDMVISPEYISLSDLMTSVELLVRASGQIPGEHEAYLRKRIFEGAEPGHDRLKSTFETWRW
ncbi:MAG: hypothetical protein ACYC27_12700 [Armatimonadota bacterium]